MALRRKNTGPEESKVMLGKEVPSSLRIDQCHIGKEDTLLAPFHLVSRG